MNDRPPVIDEYREICAEIARLTADKESLQPKVKKLIEESGGWPDCYLQESKRRDYIDEPILEWIKADYPHLMDRLLMRVIDWEAFKACLNRREIDIRRMPDNCSIETKMYSVRTKKRKKDEDTSQS